MHKSPDKLVNSLPPIVSFCLTTCSRDRRIICNDGARVAPSTILLLSCTGVHDCASEFVLIAAIADEDEAPPRSLTRRRREGTQRNCACISRTSEKAELRTANQKQTAQTIFTLSSACPANRLAGTCDSGAKNVINFSQLSVPITD